MSAPVRASTNASYDSAMSSCQADMAANTWHGGNWTAVSANCVVQSPAGAPQCIQFVQSGTNGGTVYTNTNQAQCFSFSGAVPTASPCLGMTPQNIYQDGQVLAGSQMCVHGPTQSDGSSVMCGEGLSPISRPTYNPNRGLWETYISVTPTGSVCGLGTGTQPGVIAGPSGAPAPNAGPAVPDPLPPTLPTPPQICSGTSCYNPGSGTSCISAGSTSLCAPTPPLSGCTSGASATICGGSPPPLPAQPPASPISDPATQITGSTTVQQVDPTTGAPLPTTTITVYTNSTGTSSGAKTGDSVPAGASTAPAPASSSKGSYSGGTSCTTPPACSGDPVACGAARTQWATTCQLHTDLAGSGQPSDLAALKTKYGQGDAWATPSTGGTLGDAANTGSYDQTGFGYAQSCPLKDLVVPWVGGQSFAIPFSSMCFVGGWIRGIVLAFSLFWAAIITKGGKA